MDRGTVKFLMLFKGSLLPPLTDLLSRIEGSGPQENASFLNHFDYIKVRQMALFTAVLFWLGLFHCGKSPFFNPKATGLVLQTK